VKRLKHNRIHTGECLELMKLLPDSSVDMILCDLPYGTTDAEWDIVISFEDLWAEYTRVRKPGAAIVLFCTQPFTTHLISSNLKEFKYCWTWDKGFGRGHLVAKYRPMQRTEDIAVFGKGKINYFPITTSRKSITSVREGRRSELLGAKTKTEKRDQRSHAATLSNVKHPTTVLQYRPVPNGKNIHPTQKPVGLCSYLVHTYTRRGDMILDNCIGSGSVGVAARRAGRNFIGMEKNPVMAKKAKARLKKVENSISPLSADVSDRV